MFGRHFAACDRRNRLLVEVFDPPGDATTDNHLEQGSGNQNSVRPSVFGDRDRRLLSRFLEATHVLLEFDRSDLHALVIDDEARVAIRGSTPIPP